jgi:hypothetical protein
MPVLVSVGDTADPRNFVGFVEYSPIGRFHGISHKDGVLQTDHGRIAAV